MRTLKLFCVLILLPFASFSQFNYDFFISNSGSDANPGTVMSLPKQTIAGTSKLINSPGNVNGNINVGLQSGSVFNESLSPAHSLNVASYTTNSSTTSDFAILNGSDSYDSGWTPVNGTLNTYQQVITSSNFLKAPVANNSYVYVIEIDRELEKIAPITARKPMQLVFSSQVLDTTPGSFYEPVSSDSTVAVFIHTGNGSSPNANPKFRYEVAVRNSGIDGYRNDNNRFEHLWIRGYRSGYGLIPSGANTYYNKVIFGQGSGIHHIVLKSGVVNNSLFLPGSKNTSAFAVVFYDVQGFGRHNKITNSVFLDMPTPIYTHTANGLNHGALELDNVIGFADASQGGVFVSTANNDTVLLNNVYTDKYDYGYNVANNNISSKFSVIKNSVFKDVNNAIVFGSNPVLSTIDNVFIKSTNKRGSAGIVMSSFTSLKLACSIVHIKSFEGAFLRNSAASTSHISATGNIFVCDVDPGQSVTAAVTNTDKGTGTSTDTWNNNVYILLKGDKIVWTVTNKATNAGSSTVQTFEEWKRQSGQDQNSLFFDLRNDPRGLQAIFIDPERGDYELANTVEGNQVRALKAGMTSPITCFLQKPTYEEAADMIMNDKVFAVNSCRKACQPAGIQVQSSATTDADGLIYICQDQEQTFTGSGDYKHNDISYHQSDVNSRYLWWFSDLTDTSGVNLNSVKHTFVKGDSVSVRLQMVDQNGCSFDSTFLGKAQALPVLKLGADTTICKGFDITLSAYVPGASYLWNTGSGDNSLTVKDKGTYWVQTMLNGCTSRDTMELKLQDCPCSVQMPNAFSPNGDGLNDVYRPVLGCYPVTYELSVFNRYGQSVFATKNYKTFWNGKSNGKALSSGIYVYTLKVVTEISQKPKLIRGSIMLLP